MSPSLKKLGGHVPRIPHQIAPVATGELSPQKKAPRPLKMNYEAISISGAFVKFSECQSPLYKNVDSLLKTFWRQFYLSDLPPLAKCMTWNITLRMRRWREVSDFASRKFRLTLVYTQLWFLMKNTRCLRIGISFSTTWETTTQLLQCVQVNSIQVTYVTTAAGVVSEMINLSSWLHWHGGT